MQRDRSFLTALLPGQGRRPPLQVTLHAEDTTLVLAVSSANGHPAPKHPPGPATIQDLAELVKSEVGVCRLGSWESFAEVGGTPAGWMTTVEGRGVSRTLELLREE